MATGQILGGDDYGQNSGGVSLGAYVPGDENTHENARAIEHVQQINQQYQQQQAADEEKEMAKRKKAMLDVQIEPKGIRPIDKQPVLDGQDLINKYVTQAYASDKDPFDPKNPEEFQKLNTLMNAQKILVETSSGLNKQIGDEAKQYQNDKGLNYHPDSEKNIRKANTISMADYLRGDDPDVGLGRTLLKAANKYDPEKGWKELLDNTGEKPVHEAIKDNNGKEIASRDYLSKDQGRKTDDNGNEIPGTSMYEQLGDKRLAEDPKYAEMMRKRYSELPAGAVQGDMNDPGYSSYVTRNAALKKEADRQSAESLAAGGPTVTMDQVLARDDAKTRLGIKSIPKWQYSPEYLSGLKMNATSRAIWERAAAKDKDVADAGTALGLNLYDENERLMTGKSDKYTKNADGSLSAFVHKELAPWNYYVADKNGNQLQKTAPNSINEERFFNGKLYVKTSKSEYEANQSGKPEDAWIYTPDLNANLDEQMYNHKLTKTGAPDKRAAIVKQAQDVFYGNAQAYGELGPNKTIIHSKYADRFDRNQPGAQQQPTRTPEQEAEAGLALYQSTVPGKIWGTNPAPVKMKVGDKSYTRDEFKTQFPVYTEDQIIQAIKKGKIKVEKVK